MKAALFLMLLICSLSINANNSTEAFVTKNVHLKAEPSNHATAITEVAKDQAVVISERQGGWYKAQFQHAIGWIKIFYIRFKASSNTETRSGLGALFSSTQSAHSDVTLTTGVRGINEKQLSEAKPNWLALHNMKEQHTSKEVAELFAKAGLLEKQTVQYAKQEENR